MVLAGLDETDTRRATIYLFGYGSLVGRASTMLTLGRRLGPEDGPLEAYLDGYRRAWNVGSDKRSHPERTFFLDDGSEFTGTVAVLGLERRDGSRCLGAAIRITPEDIGPLKVRERNYDLIEVTARACWQGKPDACTVYAFVPSAEAVERLVDATDVVVDSNYAREVEEAFSNLTGPGSRLDEYRESVAEELSKLRQAPLRATISRPPES